MSSKWNGPPPITVPLVHPDLSGKPQNAYSNVLLIDSKVKNAQRVYDSVNASTLPIMYSTSSSSQDLFALLQTHFTSIQSLGLFFESSLGRSKGFLNMQPLFLLTEQAPYSTNVAFMINIINTFTIKGIDFLACDTLQYDNWKSYYALLSQTGVKVGASNDKTGNLHYGGDWVMESTNQNVELIYFSQNIEYYQYTLDPPTDIQTFQLIYPLGIKVIVSIDVNNFYNVFTFPLWYGGGTIYVSPPSWLYDFQLWNGVTQLYSFADLDGLVFQSNNSYPFNDPNNLTPGCIAFWTSDQNVYADYCEEMHIDNLAYFETLSYITGGMTCFKEGAMILTDKGYRAIETLRKGDKVKTQVRGFLPIDCIGTREIIHTANPERIKDQLYVCSKDAYPEATEDLVITGCHCLLVNAFASDAQKERVKQINGLLYVTDKKYRLPACADDRATVYPVAGAYNIYHFALENDDPYMNYGVYANGILVETTSIRYMTKLSKMTLL